MQQAAPSLTPFQRWILQNLTEEQYNAVTAPPEDSIMLLAGAGTGKTRVLTHRNAWISTLGINLRSCLNLTFTNKAAREMRTRIAELFGVEPGPDALLPASSTFHSFCARWLRYNAEEASEATGLSIHRDFSILDEQDSATTFQKAIEHCGPEGKRRIHPEHRKALKQHVEDTSSVLSSNTDLSELMKNDDVLVSYILASDPEATADNRRACNIIDAYEQIKTDNAALDYADLVRITLRAWESEPSLVPFFESVLVDEFQDTDSIQSRLLACLAPGDTPLFAVGDDDQAIYTWRGARIDNLYDLPRTKQGMRILHLTENFRSTQTILNVANAALRPNTRPYPKTLVAATSETSPTPALCIFDDPHREADWLIKACLQLADSGYAPYGEQAILSRRARDLSALEACAVRAGIPYRITAGRRFAHRAEIQNLNSWLRVLLNPSDTEALKRVLTNPKRGFGDATAKKLNDGADRRGIPVAEALRPVATAPRIPSKARDAMLYIADLREQLLQLAHQGATPLQILEQTYDRSGLKEALETDLRSPDRSLRDAANSRQERITALFGLASDAPSISSLADHLSTSDIAAESHRGNALTLSTIHAAKGLEWTSVAIIALEENAFPNAAANQFTIQEERRLLHVASTRAKRYLMLSACNRRSGQTTTPSRFISEIADTLAPSIHP